MNFAHVDAALEIMVKEPSHQVDLKYKLINDRKATEKEARLAIGFMLNKKLIEEVKFRGTGITVSAVPVDSRTSLEIMMGTYNPPEPTKYYALRPEGQEVYDAGGWEKFNTPPPSKKTIQDLQIDILKHLYEHSEVGKICSISDLIKSNPKKRLDEALEVLVANKYIKRESKDWWTDPESGISINLRRDEYPPTAILTQEGKRYYEERFFVKAHIPTPAPTDKLTTTSPILSKILVIGGLVWLLFISFGPDLLALYFEYRVIIPTEEKNKSVVRVAPTINQDTIFSQTKNKPPFIWRPPFR